MSQMPTPPFAASTSFYRYLIVGALSIVVAIGFTLFWRRAGTREWPRLHDVYLDGHGESWAWAEIMPLSVEVHRPNTHLRRCRWTSKGTGPFGDGNRDVDDHHAMPMPSPDPNLPSSCSPRSPQDIKDVEDGGEPPPYVEFGLADLQLPKGVFDLDSLGFRAVNTTTPGMP
ncbi:hypothetical protein B0H13DRAFT_2051294 [Mycena leptocephala]|nr:hypothetical protein B0H13DRAFT_2051294 [Mycena leptocephala]